MEQFKFHESTPTFLADGKTMYFTRNNYLDGKKEKMEIKLLYNQSHSGK
jgi:hypothetical protein